MPIKLAILLVGVDRIQKEIQQPGDDDLCAFFVQEIFQIIIAQRRKFDINFADDAHFDFLLACYFDLRERAANSVHIDQYFIVRQSFARFKLLGDLVAPVSNQ